MLLFIVFSAIIVVVENREYTLTGPQRKIILNEHNKLRSELAFGTIKNKNGTCMPTAKNMLEMIWSEEREISAAYLADGDAKYPLIANKTEFVSDAISAGLSNWTSELNYRYENNPENKYTSYVIQQNAFNFIQMAWGKTHKIGCGIAVNMKPSRRSAVFVCLYKPCGRVENELIYELGAPCKDDRDCDDGKCLKESGLCRKKKQNQLISLSRSILQLLENIFWSL
ncbi:Cysteine-rich secretory family protein [Acanthocheilonema viteae]